jgi:hypothetical protein
LLLKQNLGKPATWLRRNVRIVKMKHYVEFYDRTYPRSWTWFVLIGGTPNNSYMSLWYHCHNGFSWVKVLQMSDDLRQPTMRMSQGNDSR